MKKLMAVLISLTLLCGAALPALAESTDKVAKKDETVYILAGADGAARKIIVSDYLSNPAGDAELEDVSELANIENVKGEQAFENGVWQAEGEDIYYQGEGETALPVEMNISYTLDGEEIAPEELAGKDGHAVIRFDFSVNQTAGNGVAVPYAVITGALLENEVFKNVQAVNARVVNDGDRTIVLGVALPGLKDSLDVGFEDMDIGEGFELPEYVEIEADVTDFALPVTLTLATSEVFARLDADALENSQDLKDAMAKLSDGMDRLLDGGAQLVDGLEALGTGVEQLAGGVDALADGLDTLVSNNDALVAGSTQVFDTLLATANAQLAAADAGVPELTIENYDETLGTLVEAMSEDGIARQARAQVEEAVRSQQEQVRAAVEQAVQAEVQAQVEAAVEANVRTQVLAAAGMTDEAYEAAVAAGQLGDEQANQIDAAVRQQLAADEVQDMIGQQLTTQMASDKVQGIIEEKTEEQVQALIEQNMASDEVQGQIEQSLAKYGESCATLAALREQLNAYGTFHSGLIAYTQGVSSAADGANQLKAGATDLADGVQQLLDGAQEMKDGLELFSSDGVEKLDKLVNEDMEALLERVRELICAAQDSQNYSGIADGMEGSARYIWRTDAIEG